MLWHSIKSMASLRIIFHLYKVDVWTLYDIFKSNDYKLISLARCISDVSSAFSFGGKTGQWSVNTGPRPVPICNDTCYRAAGFCLKSWNFLRHQSMYVIFYLRLPLRHKTWNNSKALASGAVPAERPASEKMLQPWQVVNNNVSD